MKSLKEVLIRRDKMSSSEADELIEEMRKMVYAGKDPGEVLLIMVGLEEDFIFDII